jgi:hypothetical protein
MVPIESVNVQDELQRVAGKQPLIIGVMNFIFCSSISAVSWCSGSTQDSESCNPSSNLGETKLFCISFGHDLLQHVHWHLLRQELSAYGP